MVLRLRKREARCHSCLMNMSHIQARRLDMRQFVTDRSHVAPYASGPTTRWSDVSIWFSAGCLCLQSHAQNLVFLVYSSTLRLRESFACPKRRDANSSQKHARHRVGQGVASKRLETPKPKRSRGRHSWLLSQEHAHGVWELMMKFKFIY